MPDLSRRRLFALSGSALAAGLAAGGAVATSAAPPSPAPAPASARIGRRIRLHMIQTGWVSVKAPHKAFSGPSFLRFPAILASRAWTEWLPITAFVIEHPESLILVDTGETARMLEPGYAACDPGTGWFYDRNLRFALTAEDEIGPQMRRAGLDPSRVETVVMTHLHSDHMGGLPHVPQAEVLVAEAARAGHAGALMCRIPSRTRLRGASLRERSVGVFARSLPLTVDGTVSIVPTPGHATGHQSVLIADEGVSVCLAGDAAFSLRQITSGEIGGIVESPSDARESARALARQHAAFGTVMLPAHDPDNAARLQAL